jgi:hypothetical protein
MPNSDPNLVKIVEELLKRLEITEKSLGTYGSHPIIEMGNKAAKNLAKTYLKLKDD